MSQTVVILLAAVLGSYSVNCGVVNEITDNNIGTTMQPDKYNLRIFPGTKWCGAGNIAEDLDDLGSEREADKCCREHDSCPESNVIKSGETKNNLTNDILYTRLSCECDEKFRLCLRAAQSETSTIIGSLYFNMLGTKCFRYDHPTLECVNSKTGLFNDVCLEYTYDTTQTKRYQWFDVAQF